MTVYKAKARACLYFSIKVQSNKYTVFDIAKHY